MFLLCAGCVSAATAPVAAEPFFISNQNPLTAVHGLPPPDVPPPSPLTHSVSLDISSHYVNESNARESLLLDGETYRMTYSARARRGNTWLGIDLPYVDHDGGFLDDWIIRWHRIFGLPQGGRTQAPIGAFAFRYTRDGQTRLNLLQGGGGLGDVQIRAGTLLRPNWWLESALKLPTGNSDRLLGSGSADLALAVAGATASARWGAYGRVGMVAMSRGAVLRAQQRPVVGFFSATGSYQWSPALSLTVQLDGNSGFYRGSEFVAVSGPALQFAAGPQVRFASGARLAFAVVEDPIVSSGPDVTFHLRFALGI